MSTPTSDQLMKAVHHVVHDYANFVSSAEMVITGQHLGEPLVPPINSHVFHAFLLNSRKMADFFGEEQDDDVVAKHYVPGFTASLVTCNAWRRPVNKQLAHITYTRATDPRPITMDAVLRMYNEIKTAWQIFRGYLKNPIAAIFEKEIRAKLGTEFRGLDLQ